MLAITACMSASLRRSREDLEAVAHQLVVVRLVARGARQRRDPGAAGDFDPDLGPERLRDRGRRYANGLFAWAKNAMLPVVPAQGYRVVIYDVTSASCACTDMTERSRIEEASGSESHLLDLFFESNLSCAVLLDREFNFIRVNRAYASACGRDVSSSRQQPFRLLSVGYEGDLRGGGQDQAAGFEARTSFEYPDHPEWG